MRFINTIFLEFLALWICIQIMRFEGDVVECVLVVYGGYLVILIVKDVCGKSVCGYRRV